MKISLVSMFVALFTLGSVVYANTAQSSTSQVKSSHKHLAKQAKNRITGVYCGDTAA